MRACDAAGSLHDPAANDSQAERVRRTGFTEISLVVEDLSSVPEKAGLKAADCSKMPKSASDEPGSPSSPIPTRIPTR